GVDGGALGEAADGVRAADDAVRRDLRDDVARREADAAVPRREARLEAGARVAGDVLDAFGDERVAGVERERLERGEVHEPELRRAQGRDARAALGLLEPEGLGRHAGA